MANDLLSKAGLYVDELNKIRIADPSITKQTQELKDDCHKFVDSKCSFFFFWDLHYDEQHTLMRDC